MHNSDPFEQEPVSWTTTAVLALALILFWVFGPAPGCAHGPDYEANAPLYEDPLWRATAVQDLAFDLRCDGEFDFRADCTGSGVQDRLDDLREVPAETLEPLREQARTINDQWHGR